MAERTKHRDDEFGPFLVDDGTGTAYVDPSDADLVLKSGDEYIVEGGEEPPPFIREFVDRETSIDPVGRRKRWYREYRVDVGEDVRVAGQADPHAAPDGGAPVTTGFVEAGDAPKFFVTDDVDLDLGKRLRQEALVYFLIAAVLLGFSAMLPFL